jgi:hypothetical protein
MPEYADLEIGLHHLDRDGCTVELRFSQSQSAADVRLLPEGPTVRIVEDRLAVLDPADPAYGRLLSESLFTESVREAFARARGIAEGLQVPLHVRLFIGPGAARLHRLHWETLRDPGSDTALTTDQRVLFSRYLMSQEYRPVAPRAQDAPLNAVVVIANGANLGQYGLAPLEVAAEEERARAACQGGTVTVLAGSGQATLDNLVEHAGGDCDVLYLVCHGAFAERGGPLLWLEDPYGNVAVVPGFYLVERLKELDKQPRLVVLASCQSAGAGEASVGEGGALTGLGPRLAEAGIPAVLAMQGDITLATVAEFMPAFFRSLVGDGQIDRAMAAARGRVRDRPDFWMPVLYMRLRTGRLWYAEGMEGRPGFAQWEGLLSNIAEGKCTPILGAGLVESLLGSPRDVARRWADTYRYPMAPHEREALPQVGQFLAANYGPAFPAAELKGTWRRTLLRRFGGALDESARKAPLHALLGAVGARRRQQDPAEPHRVLASLPCPVYFTTNPDDLLADALREAGKDPQVELCRWNEQREPGEDDEGDEDERPPSVLDDKDYRPSPERPLVYHLFGHLREKDTDLVVLTEDNYFDYLIGVHKNRAAIPKKVLKVLVNSGLLFLGFQMEDWSFRVLFRHIMSLEGGRLRNQPRYHHVAVQIDPEAGRIMEPELARRYLERFFHDAKITIYWGKIERFVEELRQQWAAKVRRDSPQPEEVPAHV